jgi:hypothetical protein
MSLGGLLSIGRALGRVPAQPKVYHDVGGLLPQFGSPRFGGLPVPAAASPGDGGRGTLRTPQPELGVADRPEGVRAPRANVVPVGEAVVSRRGRGKAAAPASRLVQGELALLAVRVVRNDLGGDGLELIPRPGASVGGMTLRPDRPKTVVARGGWRAWLAHWRQWWRGSER